MKTLIHNRKAGFNYEILDRIEAGIELLGPEVKALRLGQASLDGAYGVIRKSAAPAGRQEAWLIGAFISPYQPENLSGKGPDYDPRRDRKLLLTRAEIAKLAGLPTNLTIVPILVYNKARKIKLEIGIARGKKSFDKRATIKKRETEREIRREHSDR